ncbi:MAG TPA: glycosyltransferase family 2 protein [Ignavibacteria bacterium]|nr:glycosyltransferase family 2 protein [Ignavibacteria bacterium]
MISVIIINYRQKDFTDKCIRSLYENIGSYPFEVIVINNSGEDDLSYLETEFDNLKIIGNTNKGFSQANNTGVKHSKGEYLLFLNADTEIRSDFSAEFIDKFKDIKFGAAGLKLYNTDGTFQLSFWKENTFFNEIENKNDEKEFMNRNNAYINKKETEYNSIKEVDWVTGAALIMRKDVFVNIGGFDENFFLFYEDADLCKRLSDKGFPVYFYPFSNIIHYKGENVNKEFKNDSYYYSKQSQLIYYKKHNNFINNFLLRTYLFVKFFLLYIFSFKKINLDIIKLTIGISR